MSLSRASSTMYHTLTLSGRWTLDSKGRKEEKTSVRSEQQTRTMQNFAQFGGG